MVEHDWTQAEKKVYTPRTYAPLQRLYESENLPASDPAARANFLANNVLQIGYADQLGILVMLNEKGKAAVLNHLEDEVIKAHQETVPKSPEIPVPCMRK